MYAFSLEVWTLYAVSVLVILTRVFARWKMVGFKQFQADDYLMLLAAVRKTTNFRVIILLTRTFCYSGDIRLRDNGGLQCGRTLSRVSKQQSHG